MLELLKHRSLEEGSPGARSQISEEGELVGRDCCLWEGALKPGLRVLEKLQTGFSCCFRKEVSLPIWRSIAGVMVRGTIGIQVWANPFFHLQPRNHPLDLPFSLSVLSLSLSLCLSICWYWLIGSQLAMLKCHLQSTKASSRWARSWNNSLIIETTLLLSSYPSFPPVFTSLSVQLQINYKPFSYSLADIINSFVPNKQIGSTDYPPNPTHTSHYISLGNLFVYTLQRLL